MQGFAQKPREKAANVPHHVLRSYTYLYNHGGPTARSNWETTGKALTGHIICTLCRGHAYSHHERWTSRFSSKFQSLSWITQPCFLKVHASRKECITGSASKRRVGNQLVVGIMPRFILLGDFIGCVIPNHYHLPEQCLFAHESMLESLNYPLSNMACTMGSSICFALLGALFLSVTAHVYQRILSTKVYTVTQKFDHFERLIMIQFLRYLYPALLLTRLEQKISALQYLFAGAQKIEKAYKQVKYHQGFFEESNYSRISIGPWR